MKTAEYKGGYIVFSLNVYFFVIASLVAMIGVYLCLRDQNNDRQKRTRYPDFGIENEDIVSWVGMNKPPLNLMTASWLVRKIPTYCNT